MTVIIKAKIAFYSIRKVIVKIKNKKIKANIDIHFKLAYDTYLVTS